jgi:glycerol-3-phosphate dehydrogenase
MNRATNLDRLQSHSGPFDIAIIGGGATGGGIALDAASRGFSVVLCEQSDFGKGTSSRSTKLVHGGVRYLQQGNVSLVIEALRERGILRGNAPHLVRELPFVVPNYAWWEAPFYGIGLKLYDLLAGKLGFGKTRHLSREQTMARIPTLEPRELRGGVLYHDGQFDDARLLIDLCHTADAHGAILLNYMPVRRIVHGENGKASGLVAEDAETGKTFEIPARVVINATGCFADAVAKMDDADAPPLIAPSQGIHLVFDRSFLPGDAAIMVPHTADGRVMFAIPWKGVTLVGTTDTPISEASLEPRAQAQEIEFLLSTAGRYLAKPPARDDIRSIFVGIRPLVKSNHPGRTSSLSRDHTIVESASGMLTIAGGKWTTYRRMAEDCVDRAIEIGNLPERACVTTDLKIHGGAAPCESGDADLLCDYGSARRDIEAIMQADKEMAKPIYEGCPMLAAQVVYAVRSEMARTVEDVLSRRTRLLLLDARMASMAASSTARLMARELAADNAWIDSQTNVFIALAKQHLPEESGISNPR